VYFSPCTITHTERSLIGLLIEKRQPQWLLMKNDGRSYQHVIALISSLNILMHVEVTSIPVSGLSKPDLGTLPSGCLGRRVPNAAWEDMQSRHSQRDNFFVWVLGHRGHTGHFLLFNNALEPGRHCNLSLFNKYICLLIKYTFSLLKKVHSFLERLWA